jgi:hypothetical protein
VQKLFQKSRNHLKIIGAKVATCSKIHTEDTQMLVATLQDLVAWGKRD